MTLMAQTFGQMIRARREELGLSLRSQARMVGITPSYLSDLERGNRQAPPLPMVQKMALTLEMDAAELIRVARRERRDSGYVAALAAENEMMRRVLEWIKMHNGAPVAVKAMAGSALLSEAV